MLVENLGAWILQRRPRIRRHRDYKLGDRVEVLVDEAKICRSWYSGVIVDCFGSDGRSTVYDRQGRKRKKRITEPTADNASRKASASKQSNGTEADRAEEDEEEPQTSHEPTHQPNNTAKSAQADDVGINTPDELNLIHDDYDGGTAQREQSPRTVRSPPEAARQPRRHMKRPRDNRYLERDNASSSESESEDASEPEDIDERECERLIPSFLNTLLGGMAYAVRMEHMPTEHVEEVEIWRMRPAAPDLGAESTRPDVGEAVEVLGDNGAWNVGVVHSFVVRKGFLVSFENGDAKWFRAPYVRGYQIWRGGSVWVRKLKPPLPLVKKSIGLSVTHPPGGKRRRAPLSLHFPSPPPSPPKQQQPQRGKRKCEEISNDQRDADRLLGSQSCRLRQYEQRVRKRTRVAVDASGPGGLPEGWRIERLPEADQFKSSVRYVAPDGMRLSSLKEAQLYVRMMGPS